jgi:hypothetical protein
MWRRLLMGVGQCFATRRFSSGVELRNPSGRVWKSASGSVSTSVPSEGAPAAALARAAQLPPICAGNFTCGHMQLASSRGHDLAHRTCAALKQLSTRRPPRKLPERPPASAPALAPPRSAQRGSAITQSALLHWCRLVANACSRGLTSLHFSAGPSLAQPWQRGRLQRPAAVLRQPLLSPSLLQTQSATHCAARLAPSCVCARALTATRTVRPLDGAVAFTAAATATAKASRLTPPPAPVFACRRARRKHM